jgi:2-hydroxychromene-2-carboxylate isomerase
VAERIARRTLPRLVVAGSRVTLPARLGAARRRRRGTRERVELFFAFDDPCSAVAVLEFRARLAERPVELVLLPVLGRGIEGDPAVQQKREYAVTDARRLARRGGRTLARQDVLPSTDTAFLAEWVAAAEDQMGLVDFVGAALERLWFGDPQAVAQADYLRLWREHVHEDPRPDVQAVRACERRMRRRGPYETPAAWVAGRWYFAHDRVEQICEWLDELGCVAR